MHVRVRTNLKNAAKLTVQPRSTISKKGTGGARAGSLRSPIQRGGGTVFGPRPRNYGFKLNKKVKQLARKSALSMKVKSENLKVVENFTFDVPKTTSFINVMAALGLDKKKIAIHRW